MENGVRWLASDGQQWPRAVEKRSRDELTARSPSHVDVSVRRIAMQGLLALPTYQWTRDEGRPTNQFQQQCDFLFLAQPDKHSQRRTESDNHNANQRAEVRMIPRCRTVRCDEGNTYK